MKRTSEGRQAHSKQLGKRFLKPCHSVIKASNSLVMTDITDLENDAKETNTLISTLRIYIYIVCVCVCVCLVCRFKWETHSSDLSMFLSVLEGQPSSKE